GDEDRSIAHTNPQTPECCGRFMLNAAQPYAARSIGAMNRLRLSSTSHRLRATLKTEDVVTAIQLIASGVVLACLSAGAIGCSTMEPTPVSAITFGQPSPASGSTIIATGTPPGVFIPRGAGRLSIPLTVTSGRDVPWAQLWLYLYRNGNTTGNDYCGQNLPDAPTWGPFSKGQ